MNQVKEVITSMTDEDLKEMVEKKYLNYTREALNIAQVELNRRHIPFIDQSSNFPSGEDDPVFYK